ncbi:glycosyltransferase family 2 protein [Streptococcus merionis]|uniref:Rhamnosyl transferase n=1 Tax=Streptococcus merionis TaxID=400065 RepID=A0A239STV9_9STRE|nr:glycosyltransferase family 2 protein [Streptococcus merionis]SNU88662.1 rhamnosyl transferase [Streptococcus merionis]
MKVTILMATYNGERYLAEQIESIRKQSFRDWTLLIRDDGSTDQTRQIIADYEQLDARIRLITPNSFDNYGVIKSFFTLLKHEKADYYFFSDQDDVWLPDKLQIQLEAAQTYSKQTPLLIYTDLKVVDQELHVMHESMIRTQSDHANTSLRQELTENTVTGGTMMINHALAQLWTDTDDLLMHDWYLALLAAAFGHLIYLPQPTELYRQHADNVLGARTLRKRFNNWIRPHVLFDKYWSLIKASQKQAKKLLDFPLKQEDKAMVEGFVYIMEQPAFGRLKTLRDFGLGKNRFFHTLVFRTLILTKFAYRRHKSQ